MASAKGTTSTGIPRIPSSRPWPSTRMPVSTARALTHPCRGTPDGGCRGLLGRRPPTRDGPPHGAEKPRRRVGRHHGRGRVPRGCGYRQRPAPARPQSRPADRDLRPVRCHERPGRARARPAARHGRPARALAGDGCGADDVPAGRGPRPCSVRRRGDSPGRPRRPGSAHQGSGRLHVGQRSGSPLALISNRTLEPGGPRATSSAGPAWTGSCRTSSGRPCW